MTARVASLSMSPDYTFTKVCLGRVRLVRGIGVEGDVHSGETVKHRSRMAKDPTQPNLRQVHLIAKELLDELRREGFEVSPGRLGENVLTEGLDLLGLPTGTRLTLGDEAVLEVSGLRNPCRQLNDVGYGLMSRLIDRRPDGSLVRKAGVMAIVLASGEVAQGDPIGIELPAEPHVPLEKV